MLPTQQLKKNSNPALSITINVEFGKLSNVMDWCRQNCNDGWKVEEKSLLTLNYGKFCTSYEFSFTEEQDLLLFSLKFV